MVALVHVNSNMLVSNIPFQVVIDLHVVISSVSTMEKLTSVVKIGFIIVVVVSVHVADHDAVEAINGFVLVSKPLMVVLIMGEAPLVNVLANFMFVVLQLPKP